MARAEHPFFLNLLGFSSSPPLIIITEYIPNSSLFKFRHSAKNRAKLTPTVRTLIAMSLANAMAFLHKLGIVHRDLKSMNVLIDDNLLPKLCDFGVARFLKAYEPMTQSAGTPNWMAPEMQIDSNYGPEVDVYSYAMVLYELVTDDIPWKSLSSASIVKKVVAEQQRPKLPQNGNQSIKELIKMCWANNPKDRPSFQDIFKMFKTGRVEFDGTDQGTVGKLAEKIRKFEESQKWSSISESITKNVISNIDRNSRYEVPKNERTCIESSSQISQNKQPNHIFIDMEAISDSRSFSFKTELDRAAKFLPQIQSRQFFTAISSFLRDDADPGNSKLVLNALQKILQKNCHCNTFLELELHKSLPYSSDHVIDALLDVLFVLISKKTKFFDIWFRDIMIDIITKRPNRAIVLLGIYAQAFDSIPNSWPLLDLLIEKSQSFVKAEVGAELVSVLYFLCYNFDEYSKSRKKQSIHVFKKCLESKDNRVISLCYNALSNFYASSLRIDFGLINEHLQNSELVPFALRLLIRINDIPPLPELIRSLVVCGEKYQEATLCLVKIAALEDGACYLIRKSSWLTKLLPTIEDTLRLFLAVLTHHELRPSIGRIHNAIMLIKALCKDGDLILFTSLIIRKLEINKKTFDDMKEEGVVKYFIRSALQNDDPRIEANILLALFVLGEAGYAPEYNDYADKLKKIIVDSGNNAVKAISVVTLLSQYQPCVKIFVELKLHKFFRRLLNDQDYREYAETFLYNYSQIEN